MTRIALNGLGRIGKLVLRDLIDTGAAGEIVLLNDPVGDAEQHALLMEFDSVHGRWRTPVAAGDGALVLNGQTIRLRHEKTSGALNLVYGVNHHLYDGSQALVTAASCTTNCLAPVVKVIHESLGIRHGSITTIHDVTNTQTIVDRPAKDMRRARSALMNLIPTTTGSATAITLIYPELKGRLNGHAVRVPLLNASLTDCVFEVERATTAEEVNALFAAAAEGPLKGILGFETRPLVSCDFTNDPRSSIVDGPSTMVINGTQVKIYAWYDNEWGYACRLADIARMVAGSL